MRILILLDNKIINRKADADVALERIKADYYGVSPVSWEYKEMDFSGLRWVEYQPKYLGIALDIVYKDVGVVTKDKYDQIIYLVSEENWKAVGIGGWNLGTPIKGFAVQLIRIYANSPEWLYKTFAMEIAHSWNDMCIQEIGDNLLSTFGVTDFDNQVIHGADKRYGVNVPDNPSMSGYYTDYNYAPMIAMAKDPLSRAFAKRLDRYNNPPQFQFTKNLFVGMMNNDVYELQKRLVAESVATFTPTSFFGNLTRVSVIAYQKKHGITPALGFVGTITRAKLNSTVSAQAEPFHLDEHH